MASPRRADQRGPQLRHGVHWVFLRRSRRPLRRAEVEEGSRPARRGAERPALLVRAASTAVVTPRFFQSVGRTMILADEQINGGENRQIIRKAFERHNIALGAGALLGATAVLSGAAPRPSGGRSLRRRRRTWPPASAYHRRRGSRLMPWTCPDTPCRRSFTRTVSRWGRWKSLKEVVIEAPVPVLLGDSGGRAAVMGDIPEPVSTEREVQTFAESLPRETHARRHVRKEPAARPGALELRLPSLRFATAYNGARSHDGRETRESEICEQSGTACQPSARAPQSEPKRQRSSGPWSRTAKL